MDFKKEYKNAFEDCLKNSRIRPTAESFKINLFLKKAKNSLLIAKHIKEINPGTGEPEKLYWNYWAVTISYYSMLYAAKAAIHGKGYSVTDHDAAQIALGHLLVPDKMEKEDLELLNQSHLMFEDEYVKYFEDAKNESQAARYSAIKSYSERRLEEIFENATSFIAKIGMILA